MTSIFFEAGLARDIYNEAWESEKPYRGFLEDPGSSSAPVQFAAYAFLEDTLENTEEGEHVPRAPRFLFVSYFRCVIDRLKSKDAFLKLARDRFRWNNWQELAGRWEEVQGLLQPFITHMEEEIAYGKLDGNDLYQVGHDDFADSRPWRVLWSTYHPEYEDDPDQEVESGFMPDVTPLSHQFKTKEEVIRYIWGE